MHTSVYWGNMKYSIDPRIIEREIIFCQCFFNTILAESVEVFPRFQA